MEKKLKKQIEAARKRKTPKRVLKFLQELVTSFKKE